MSADRQPILCHESETACTLAGLGSLVCAWLAGQAQERMQLHLAGRTGRAALGTSAWLHMGTAIVIMQRCDVASVDEAQELCRRPHAGPLSALIHAGKHSMMETHAGGHHVVKMKTGVNTCIAKNLISFCRMLALSPRSALKQVG